MRFPLKEARERASLAAPTRQPVRTPLSPRATAADNEATTRASDELFTGGGLSVDRYVEMMTTVGSTVPYVMANAEGGEGNDTSL